MYWQHCVIGILTGLLRWITMQECVCMCECASTSSGAVKSIDLCVWSMENMDLWKKLKNKT